jgi:hypothetical protein
MCKPKSWLRSGPRSGRCSDAIDDWIEAAYDWDDWPPFDSS